MILRSNSKVTNSTILFVFITWVVASGMMFYSSGSGEHDTFMMVAGILHGANIGKAINPLDYGPDLQFMFYHLFNLILRMIPLMFDQIFLSINIMGTLSSLLIPILLLIMLRRYFKLASPQIVPIILITTPAYLFTLPYGHPFHMAFSLCLIAFILFFSSHRAVKRLPKYLLFSLAVMIMGTALTIRAEQIMLFWFVIFGLFIYTREQDRLKWFGIFLLLILSVAIFALFHFLLTPSSTPTISNESPISPVSALAKLVITTYKPSLFLWSMAHHLIEIGFPLIVFFAFALIKCLREKNGLTVFGLGLSMLPSALIYLVNPSPPRHHLITILAIAMFLSISVDWSKLKHLYAFGAILLAFNLLLPPALSFISGGDSDSRPSCTYNIVQRHFRNKDQIKESLPFFSEVLVQVPSGTIIFGQWIHVAQISMLLSSRKDLEFEKTQIAGFIKALRFRYNDKEIYLVETYNNSEVERSVTKLRKTGEKLYFMSLLSDNLQGEDVIIMKRPEKLLWWNA